MEDPDINGSETVTDQKAGLLPLVGLSETLGTTFAAFDWDPDVSGDSEVLDE
jgi:hypothetical protein